VDWTDEQKQVITERNKDILVSAAAGSGKTAVLVERIIQRLADKDNPASIDRMLVVTFTEAAASEMRERILQAITAISAREPENEYLQKQITYIHSAQISTIHSFCISLIRDHFDVLGIDPAFRVASEDELELIKEDVMHSVLEEHFTKGDKGFLDFVESRCSGMYENELYRIVMKAFSFSQSHPFPEKWLEECVRSYDRRVPFEEKQWYIYMKEEMDDRLFECRDKYKKAIDICGVNPGYIKCKEVLVNELEHVEKAIECDDYFERSTMLNEILFITWPRVDKKAEVDPDEKEEVKNLRTTAKEIIKSIRSSYCVLSVDAFENEMDENFKSVNVIVGLARDFADRFAEYKREKNIIDYNDMEHFALQILTDVQEDGTVVKSEIAKEIAENYDEIMTDEYQDINLVQEYILNAVAGGKGDDHNRFMVGDVKQSIYRFRMAKPELFISKYNSYTAKPNGDNIRITLGKNFRSREEVVRSVNFIFEQIMGEKPGGISYDEDQMLYYGSNYKDINTGSGAQNTEILLLDSKEEDSRITGDERFETEGAMIAYRIKELMSSGFCVTEKNGDVRPLRYSDIAILVRSIKGSGDVIAEALIEQGIPTFAEKSSGYFDTTEIVVLLNMLRVIDNPHQDIPLTSVLKNIFGVTSKELSLCALERKDDFYGSLKAFAEKSPDEMQKDVAAKEEYCELQNKIRNFFDILEGMRFKAEYMSISDIIREILEITGYGYYIRTMPAGETRTANIRLLISKAEDYEKTSYTGLFNFVRFMDNIKKYDVDRGEASALSSKDDTVRIMTIHKSKGLEFPVVFLACTGKKFNDSDVRQSIVINDKVGIGLSFIDPDKRIKRSSPVKEVTDSIIIEENVAEELRILYVALTRAREKLIITGLENIQAIEQKFLEYKECKEKQFDKKTILSMNSYLKLIMLACARCDNLAEKSIIKRYLSRFELVETRVEDNLDNDLFMLTLEEQGDNTVKKDGRDGKDPCRYFGKEYAYRQDTLLNSKYSVSEIKKKMYEDGVDEEDERQVQLFEAVHSVESYVPAFIKAREKLVGAGRGTAYHRVFELVDYGKNMDTVKDIAAQIDELHDKGYIDDMMKDVVEPQKIHAFVDSEIGRRMKRAYDNKCLYREQQYVMSVPASELDENYGGTETILVQGAIDAYFIEDGKAVIVDYKTDGVSNVEELETLYAAQLKYYAKAVEQITGYEVSEMIIYSVKFNKCLVLK